MEEFSQVFSKLKYIKFTDAGKIALSGFSDSVILYADSNIGGKTTLDKPFNYFYGICKRNAKEHFEDIDHGRILRLGSVYNIDPNGETVEEFNPAGIPGREGISSYNSNQEARAISEAKYREQDKKAVKRIRDAKITEALKPLKGDAAIRRVAFIRKDFELGLYPAKELMTWIERQRDMWEEETEGLLDLYHEMKDKDIEVTGIKKEHIQSILPF